ncbi:PqqD family peptide modification chaperone [Falsiroseomonas oryzae]|uniref:PqqD family peptide modification chaperone n=1 Tax=Falsiroseomonas oryzae TaxID=2766473 RepID=UPI0022EB7FD8|nr:PqqD family peptide modification chaperone [Roseomonas sp. MO-31]
MARDAFLSGEWHRVGRLRPRLRPHVKIHRHRYRGETWYVLQDHASGRYHRFSPAAYALAGMMDGERTVDELWKELVAQLGDDAPTQTSVVNLLSQLHAADLLQTDVAADAAEMMTRRGKQQRRKLLGRAGNPLAIKIPLWDPDRFLVATLPFVRPFLSRFGAVLWLLVVGFGVLLAGMHREELTANLADRVMTPSGLLLIAVVFPFLKLLHELGHAYATRAGGGEVREMGVMFMALAPVPYVDGTASAAFRSKWRRAGVGAAGVIVEAFVAALAMVAWTLLEPGLARALCFNVMLVAGVSTIVFNLNPLLKLDGYFIACDLLEIPNLGGRANKWWGWLAEAKLFGADVEPPVSTAWERFWFALYAPASFVWRIAVVLGIALFVAEHFFVVGALMAIGGILLTIVWPLAKAFWHVGTSPRLQLKRGRAMAMTFGGLAAAALLLTVVPAPLRTTSEGVVWLPEETIVRAGSDGFVRAVATAPGSWVAPGAPLVQADHPDLESEVVVLRTQIEALRARLDSEQFTNRVQAEVTRQEITLKTQQLARAEERLDALLVRASAEGTFRVPRAEDLPGRYVKRGDVLGFVTPREATLARVVVPQADIDLVRGRLDGVEVKLPGRIWEPLPARLVREVPAASERLPSRALAVDGGGRFAADPSAGGENPRTLERLFQFDLALPAGTVQEGFGARVFVRFDHGAEPLGAQWWRRGRQLVLARLQL